MNRGHQDFETTIRLAIQDVAGKKNHDPKLNISTQYQLGKLDGYTELLETLYREEQKATIIANGNPQTSNILNYLYENGRTRHDELARFVGCDYDSLISIIQRMLQFDLIEYSSFCRHTFYYLTDSGKMYCDRCLSKKG